MPKSVTWFPVDIRRSNICTTPHLSNIFEKIIVVYFLQPPQVIWCQPWFYNCCKISLNNIKNLQISIKLSIPKQQDKVILVANWCHLTMSLKHCKVTSGWCHYFEVKMMYVNVILMSLCDISLTLFCLQWHHFAIKMTLTCHHIDIRMMLGWGQTEITIWK